MLGSGLQLLWLVQSICLSPSPHSSASMPMGWGVANKLVFTKVKEALGLEKAKILAVGAAPTHMEVSLLLVLS